MKTVYFIYDKHQPHRNMLIGIDKNDVDSAKRSLEKRLEINWDNVIWSMLCNEETYEYVKRHLIFGGFNPYEIEGVKEIHLEAMKDMHFYKEITMMI